MTVFATEEPTVEEALKDPAADGQWLRAQIDKRLQENEPNPYLTLVIDVAKRMGLVLPDGHAPTRWSWMLNRKAIEAPYPGWNALIFRYVARRQLIKLFGFAIPSGSALRSLALLGPIVEMGAGCGYWAHQLSRLGADVVAFDKTPAGDPNLTITPWERPWFNVQKGTVEKVADYPDRTLLLGWPPFGDMAVNALNHYKGYRVVHIGAHGLTGDLEFYKALERDWVLQRSIGIPQWEAADDRIDIWQRR